MPQLKLSGRLSAIAGLIPPEGGVADIGTDHGYIPVWLRLNGYTDHILATDINPQPLGNAIETAIEYGVEDKISFLMCDGLKGVCNKHLGCVVIAGMGGENIAEILSQAHWTAENGCLLILQPMTRADRLRSWLFNNGYVVTGETLVQDDRLYEIITARGGRDALYTPGQLYTGRLSLIKGNPLFPQKLEGLIAKQKNAIRGLSRSVGEGDSLRLEQVRGLLAEFEAMGADAVETEEEKRHADG